MLAIALMLGSAAGGHTVVDSCRVLLTAKRAGEPIYSEDVALVACPDAQPSTLLRYDNRKRLIVARKDLAAGTDLGRAYLPARPAVAAGEPVRVTVAIGHVTISRRAEALQTARPGERFFVRTTDGKIFVAPAVQGSGQPAKGQR
jgi:flagella basal body P-ring formation protein FlgA